MQQRGSATFRVLATAIMKRYTAATRESQRGLTGFSVIFGLVEVLRPEAFNTSSVSGACSGAIAPMRRAVSEYCRKRQGVRDAAVVASPT